MSTTPLKKRDAVSRFSDLYPSSYKFGYNILGIATMVSGNFDYFVQNVFSQCSGHDEKQKRFFVVVGLVYTTN